MRRLSQAARDARLFLRGKRSVYRESHVLSLSSRLLALAGVPVYLDMTPEIVIVRRGHVFCEQGNFSRAFFVVG